MVKLKGPGLAAGASGSIGGVLVFSQTRGRHYAKKLTIPKQPRPEHQVASRATLTYLAHEWTTENATSKATWEQLVPNPYVDRYRAYVGHNLERWLRFAPPIWRYPAAESYTPADPGALTVTPQGRRAMIAVTLNADPKCRCVIIFRRPGAIIVPRPKWTIQIYHAYTHKTYHTEDHGLAPGNYKYAAITCAWDGLMSAGYLTDGVTIT